MIGCDMKSSLLKAVLSVGCRSVGSARRLAAATVLGMSLIAGGSAIAQNKAPAPSSPELAQNAAPATAARANAASPAAAPDAAPAGAAPADATPGAPAGAAPAGDAAAPP